MNYETVLFEDTKRIATQRAVALEMFYSSSTGRFDTFLETKDYEDQTGR